MLDRNQDRGRRSECRALDLPRYCSSRLTACGRGRVDIEVATTDNCVDNSTSSSGGGSNNPRASYTASGTTEVRQGTSDGRIGIYSSSFVGQNVASGAAPAGGTGPKPTIAAGSTFAFSDSADYVLINRESQIIARGSPAAPIAESTPATARA